MFEEIKGWTSKAAGWFKAQDWLIGVPGVKEYRQAKTLQKDALAKDPKSYELLTYQMEKARAKVREAVGEEGRNDLEVLKCQAANSADVGKLDSGLQLQFNAGCKAVKDIVAQRK